MTPANTTSVLEQLTSVVNLYSRGTVPIEVASNLAGARLIAIQKPNSKGGHGIRPVAVGEIIRRLVGKCMCQTIKEESRELLFPLQIGVAVAHGADIGIHTIRNWCQRMATTDGKAGLKVDFSNAFNCVDKTDRPS